MGEFPTGPALRSTAGVKRGANRLRDARVLSGDRQESDVDSGMTQQGGVAVARAACPR